MTLKAPFPAFGGKSRVAPLVWERLGDVVNFVEPFCNSAAVLLSRPTPGRIETVNDLNSYVANFWRAVQADPGATAAHADWPVNETDLHARHRWLVLSCESQEFRERMKIDPGYFDPRIAGWWAWGACCWIGAGWCSDFGSTSDGDRKQVVPAEHARGVHAEWGKLPDISGHAGGSGRGVHQASGPTQKRPNISGFFNEHGERQHHGRGVHSKVPDDFVPTAPDLDAPDSEGRRPHLSSMKPGYAGMGVHASHRPQLADQYARGRGVHSNDQAGTCEQRRAWLVDWFSRLADRLRTVRVCCGHWLRVCDSFSVTTRLGVTGIFFDAPYKTHLADGTANRSGDLYANDRSQDVNALVDDVIAYCLERGSDPLMRIAACCYEGEGYEALEARGWTVHEWKAGGGYANRSKSDAPENAARERIWFSPACLKAHRDRMPLFDREEARP